MSGEPKQATFLAEEVFDFDIERSDEPLIARAGLVLPHHMAKALGLPREIDRELPAPGSPRGLDPSAFVMPIVLNIGRGRQGAGGSEGIAGGGELAAAAEDQAPAGIVYRG